MTKQTVIPLTAFVLMAGFAAPALAGPPAVTRSAPKPRLDVEVDPIAYALSGYSAHLGVTWKRLRLDVGVFALEIPETLHGTDGVDVWGHGFGAKLDYYITQRDTGLFAGVQLSRMTEKLTDRATMEEHSASHITIGARIGYRYEFGRGFYVLPWLGVDVSMSSRDQRVADKSYEPGAVLLFPTVHLGKRF
jgi:hypothetical protein